MENLLHPLVPKPKAVEVSVRSKFLPQNCPVLGLKPEIGTQEFRNVSRSLIPASIGHPFVKFGLVPHHLCTLAPYDSPLESVVLVVHQVRIIKSELRDHPLIEDISRVYEIVHCNSTHISNVLVLIELHQQVRFPEAALPKFPAVFPGSGSRKLTPAIPLVSPELRHLAVARGRWRHILCRIMPDVNWSINIELALYVEPDSIRQETTIVMQPSHFLCKLHLDALVSSKCIVDSSYALRCLKLSKRVTLVALGAYKFVYETYDVREVDVRGATDDMHHDRAPKRHSALDRMCLSCKSHRSATEKEQVLAES